MKWYLLLMAFLFPGIGPDDELPAEDDEVPEDDTTSDEDEAPEPDEDLESEQEATPEPRISRVQRDIIKARERAQTAERDLAEARRELAESRRVTTPAQPSQDQVLWQQEEDTLRNPEATDWQKYAIQANRSARMANTNSQNALQRAEDLADRTSFAAVGASKPKLYAAYKDRVEDMLKELRTRGNNAPREKLLAILVGEDMLSGKLKSSEGKATRPASPARASARSDVSAASGTRLSDSEKRARRLENVRI